MAALFLSPLAALAQTAPANTTPMAPVTAPVKHHHHGSRYMRALRSAGLTADQKAQIKAFRSNMHTAGAPPDPAARRANAAKMRSQIDGILTPEQRAHVRAELAKQTPATSPGSAR